MKRTAATLMLLAGLGASGCMSNPQQAQKQQHIGGYGNVTYAKQIPGVQGPLGEPVGATQARGVAPNGSGIQQAGGVNTLVGSSGYVRPVNGVSPTRITSADGCTNCAVPGIGGGVIRDGYGVPPGYGASVLYGPQMPKMPNTGILPVPSMGPPGAVAAGPGAMTGLMTRPGMANGRSSINFTGPAGMKVTWQLPDGSFNDEAGALTAPKEYNFLQGQVYRLRLTSILPDHPGRAFYPTLEVAPASPKTLTFLAHSSVPITFSADDFAQAKAGNLVVKVVYLPDPANQDFSTVVGAEEVVSTRLEPGADPVAEAQRRGTILAVIRMGNIDLENRVSPSMTAPPPGMFPPGMLPGPRPVPPKGGLDAPPMKNTGLDPYDPVAPIAPKNPPGTATVNPPAALPALSPIAPTDLPPPPVGAKPPAVPAPPIAPGPKAK